MRYLRQSSLGVVAAMLAGAAACSEAQPVAPAPAQPMNVVFFLIDDLGWRDLGCYGSDYYRTPNIDALSASGVRFTDAYAACNVCSPTRAAVMTGKYPARLMLTQWLPNGRWDPQHDRMREARYMTALALEEVTVAEALREAGYTNGFIGKWHLGQEPYYYPEHQGFDLNVAGRDYGAPGSYFYPYGGDWKIPTTGQVLHKPPPIAGKPGDYLTDRLTDEAVGFVRDNAQHPFFLMLSHYAVHTPLQGKPDLKEKYAKVRKADRQGAVDYAAMIESVDESVGRVLAALEELSLSERTLVVFTSDNGGFAKATDNTPLRANKGSNYEGGIRVPLIVRWPGVSRPGSSSDALAISTDFYPTILAAAGQPARPYQHVDGVNLESALRGEPLPRDAIYWHYPHYNQHPQQFPSGVIRHGDWKLIENYESGAVSLYNLADDLGETNDLAASQSQQVASLQAKLHAWLQETGADMMRPNPEYLER